MMSAMDRLEDDASVAAMHEGARALVMRYGWNSTSYQILNQGMAHWQPRERQAAEGVVGYVARGRHVIAAGAPVCAEGELPGVAEAFEDWARRGGRQVCYFGAEARLRELLDRSPRHTTIALGAQPVWDPRGWDALVAQKSSLRSQLRRAVRKGVFISAISTAQARDEAGVRECLAAWLGSKPLPPMQFLVQPQTLAGGWEDRLVWAAREDMKHEDMKHEARTHTTAPESLHVSCLHVSSPPALHVSSLPGSRVVGFLVASPVPCRNGYLIEQIVRRPDAPNGTAELLIDAAMRGLAERGCSYATLGMVALADHAAAALSDNPAWLRMIFAWARAHGRRFYNFAGLEQFRAKMSPDRWDAVYAIVNTPRFSPTALHDIAGAFCGGAPEIAIARGVGRALRQEIGRVGRRLRRWGGFRV